MSREEFEKWAEERSESAIEDFEHLGASQLAWNVRAALLEARDKALDAVDAKLVEMASDAASMAEWMELADEDRPTLEQITIAKVQGTVSALRSTRPGGGV